MEPDRDPTDPRRFDPKQRVDELAAILAVGVRRALALRPPPPRPDSSQNGLDVSSETSVHVPVELTQPESAQGVET
jgi:hypothetical protein